MIFAKTAYLSYLAANAVMVIIHVDTSNKITSLYHMIGHLKF